MAIYTPYFYIIQDKSNGMYYAGAKWGKDANPDNFMVEGGYQTSSETIKELICQYGLNSFIIRKIRVFVTGAEAYNHEKRFLQRVDAKNNDRFYNKHNNALVVFHDDDYKNMMQEKYGVDHPLHSDEIKEKMKRTNMERYGAENVFSRDSIIRNNINTKISERYDVANISQLAATKDKIKQTSLERYGVEHFLKDPNIIQKRLDTISMRTPEETKEISDMVKNTKALRYGNSNYNNTDKMRQTNLERYGVEYISQVPEISQKMAAGISKTKRSSEWKTTKGADARIKLSTTLNSEEWKNTKGVEKSKKISEKMKGKHTGEDNSNYGNKWSDEQKRKLSEKRIGENHPTFGWIWITDGIISRKINPTIESIPEDWRRGRSSRRKVICPE
jgi:hypothetical protein